MMLMPGASVISFIFLICSNVPRHAPLHGVVLPLTQNYSRLMQHTLTALGCRTRMKAELHHSLYKEVTI